MANTTLVRITKSTNHQYSGRLDRPENTKYLVKQTLIDCANPMVSPNAYSLISRTQRYYNSLIAVLSKNPTHCPQLNRTDLFAFDSIEKASWE